jgi:hypothetical protein
MQYEPEQADALYESFRKAAKDYQDYVNIKEEWKERSKNYLAALMLEAKQKSDKTSNAELEMIARASEGYKEHCEKLYGVLKEEGRRWIAYEANKKKMDLWQSAMAMRREELKKLIA